MPNGFITNAHRIDPYKNYKFRLLWDQRVVLGVSKVSALKRTTEVVTHRDGGDNSRDHKSPGRTTYEGITLERGITHDPEFEAWANRIHSPSGDPGMDLKDMRKDVVLEMMNERGQVVKRYFLHRCWVSEYTAVPDLDANANAVAIESLKLELEYWERDPETKEPDETAPVPASA
ncbi:phage tail protein [Roseitranquillus sediminis]|uniref:phage tail protein n=1 Tax=Roseitranquillus sediminis TaxID=2809051 RepID=UPI001D0CC26D|nr:phage tail protein [Roseitranquillus sediminis]MBM9594988.1 phage tail protein [Roseitranquillus sediminis]